jgi:hypothetical protein
MQNSLSKRTDLSPENVRAAFGNYTGSDYSISSISYPYLIILQSDKTYENFFDGEDLTKKEHGKLFIRSSNKNHSEDLMDSVQGILIKEQKGAELWSENRFLWSKSGGFANSSEKEQVSDKYGVDPSEIRNVIKLLIRLPKTVTLKNGEKHNLVILTIKGSSFMPYNETVKAEQKKLFMESEEIKRLGYKFIEELPVVFWGLTISAKEQIHPTNKRKYYIWDFKVRVVPTNTALALKGTMDEAGKYDLISMKPISDLVAPEVIAKEEEYEEVEEVDEITEIEEDNEQNWEDISSNDEASFDVDDIEFDK